MENHNLLGDESGFTLIEVISVLIILGVLAAIAVPKYVAMEEDAKNRAIDAGIAELNGREKLMWAKLMLSDVGYKDDVDLFNNSMIAGGYYDLGEDYTWFNSSDPSDLTQLTNPDGAEAGRLSFQKIEKSVKLKRLISSRNQPAIWIRDTSP